MTQSALWDGERWALLDDPQVHESKAEFYIVQQGVYRVSPSIYISL